MKYRVKEEVDKGDVRYYPQKQLTTFFGLIKWWSNFEHPAGLMCNWVVNFPTLDEANWYIEKLSDKYNYTKYHEHQK